MNEAVQKGKGCADPNVVQATIHYLMTKYSLRPDARIAEAIVYHLDLLHQNPGVDASAQNPGLYRHLSDTWKNIAAGRERGKRMAATGKGRASLH